MSKKLSVRLSDENYDEMSKRAQANNTTIAREINRALASSEVVDVRDERVIELRAALTLIAADLVTLNTNVRKRGTNVNTIAKKLNANAKILEQSDNAIVLTKNIEAYAKQDELLRLQIQALAERVDDAWRSLR